MVGSYDSEDGFTLVELLVVIVIIGILSAIAIGAFLNQRQKANEAALRSDMRTMANEMYTFYAKHHNVEDAFPEHTESGVSNNGWSVIVRNGEDARFAGDRMNTVSGNVYLEGMEHVRVSEGVGIGVVTSYAPSMSRQPGEFCIVGNVKNSKYETLVNPPAGTSAFSRALYFDSALGGLTEPEDLTNAGACGYYATRIAGGN